MKNLTLSSIARRLRAREIVRSTLSKQEKSCSGDRRWDDTKEYSYAMRSKEDAQDYRYFPEPDLVPIIISDEWLDEIKKNQPEFRDENSRDILKNTNFLNMMRTFLRE